MRADTINATGNSRFLGWIERAGNKLPDPVFLFLYLIAGLILLSVFGAAMNWSAVHPTEIDPETGAPTGYAAEARALGLSVHTWTFHDDDRPAWAATPEDEIRAALAAGATGIFTDFPATGRTAADGR
jgi:hypothetical protein